jgi:hypothetical protein
MSAIEPPPDFCVRHCQRMVLQARDPSLPIEPEAEASNVFDIRAARTRRATAVLMRGRSWPLEPAS